MVTDEMAKDKTEKPPNLRKIERTRLRKAALEVKEVIGFIGFKTHSLGVVMAAVSFVAPAKI